MSHDDLQTVLSEPFPRDKIKTKPGRHGKRLSYIDTASVIRRLNKAFGVGWSFEVKESKHVGDTVVVLGRFSFLGDGYNPIECQQYGSHQIYENGDIGDAFKSAASDALKKCATLLGVGLHLYE